MTEQRPSRARRLLRELKRRKVYQVGAAYVVVGFGVAQGAEYLFGIAGLPMAASRAVAIVALLGLPVALVLAWAYEVRPEDPAPTDTPAGAPGRDGSRDALPAARGSAIVVLPFDNISPDPSDAYFADGLTEEITASLASIRDLRVTSRTSATVVKQAGKDTRTIGVELGVTHVLEGSVRKAGDALRVTAQLIRADTDEHLWSERYEGELKDVFGVQEKVARAIASTLQIHLGPEEDRRLAARPMEDVVAFELCLRAREASLKWTREALEQALQYLERARARVGDNAVVLASFGYIYSQFGNMSLRDRDYEDLAERHARLALELDPENPEAHMVLGFLYQSGLPDLDRSLEHLQRSLRVKPDDPHTLTWWVIALSLAGRTEEMLAASRRLLDVDPLSPLARGLLGYALQVAGDLEGGLVELGAWRRASSGGVVERFFYAHGLALVGRRQEALALVRDFPEEEMFFSFMALLLKGALEGDTEAMAAGMTDRLRDKARRDVQLTVYVTGIYAMAGLREEAGSWLRHAVDRGFRNYPWIAVHDPWLSPLREEPELRTLYEEVRVAWETQGR